MNVIVIFLLFCNVVLPNVLPLPAITPSSSATIKTKKEMADGKEFPNDGQCEFSLRKIPGLKIVNVDKNGKKCQGEIHVPFCRGLCNTAESGTHTFPFRDQQAYFCGLVEAKGTRNMTLEECDDGIEDSARYVQISSATECQCQKM